MPRAEGVAGIGEGEVDRSGLVGGKRFGTIEPVTELAPEDVATHQLLIASHPFAGRVRVGIGEIVGIDVDQLDDPVGVSARRRDMELGVDGTDQGHILLEHVGQITEASSGRRDAKRWSAIIYSFFISGAMSAM